MWNQTQYKISYTGTLACLHVVAKWNLEGQTKTRSLGKQEWIAEHTAYREVEGREGGGILHRSIQESQEYVLKNVSQHNTWHIPIPFKKPWNNEPGHSTHYNLSNLLPKEIGPPQCLFWSNQWGGWKPSGSPGCGWAIINICYFSW
jgi:hypothetical protein